MPTYTIAHVHVILTRDIVNLTLHNSTCISKVVDIIAHSGLWSCVVVAAVLLFGDGIGAEYT